MKILEQIQEDIDDNEDIIKQLEDPNGEYPPALGKALIDPFEYALGLRDGRIIRFSKARLCSDAKWVSLWDSSYEESPMIGVDHGFPRGIDVRLSDIVWVACAPDGS